MRTVNKMGALNILDWVAGGQYISIRRENTNGRLFDGKASDVFLNQNYWNIKDELEKCELMKISAEGNTVVFGISERKMP